MPTEVSQRYLWNSQPEELCVMFALSKGSASARCELWSHLFGWELRLTVQGSLIRSQVARTPDEIAVASGEWETAMRSEGWS